MREILLDQRFDIGASVLAQDGEETGGGRQLALVWVAPTYGQAYHVWRSFKRE